MPRGDHNSGRHTGASKQVLQYLRDNPNITIPYPEIQRALHMEHAYTVSNAIQSLIGLGIPIERPQRGMCIYRPVPENLKENSQMSKLFEYVGESGKYQIVRDEVSRLYVLRPLDDLFTKG